MRVLLYLCRALKLTSRSRWDWVWTSLFLTECSWRPDTGRTSKSDRREFSSSGRHGEVTAVIYDSGPSKTRRYQRVQIPQSEAELTNPLSSPMMWFYLAASHVSVLFYFFLFYKSPSKHKIFIITLSK